LIGTGCGGAPPPAAAGGTPPAGAAPAILETVGSVGLVPITVEGFDTLTPSGRALAYYLARAAIAGRDRAWNRDGGLMLEVRDLLEEIITHPRAVDATVRESVRAYLERLWIHTGNHDHWSGGKFVPAFTPADLRGAAEAARQEGAEIRMALGETLDAKLARLRPVIFDAAFEPASPKPAAFAGAAFGVTTRRSENDRRQEAALRTLRGFLAKGAAFAPPAERDRLDRLGAAIEGGATGTFAAWARDWISSGGPPIDLLAGPEPVASDRAPGAGAWYGVASIADPARDRAVAALAGEAGALLAASPGRAGLAPAPPARAATRALLAGIAPDGPATAETLTFPGSDGREEAGFRTLILTNVEAAAAATLGRAIVAEFAPAAERGRLEAALPDARFAFSALRAVLGEAAAVRTGPAGSGSAAGDETRAVLLSARADLLALHHAVDPHFVASGLLPSTDAAEAILPLYLTEALAGLRGAAADGSIEAVDRRAQQLVVGTLVESGAAVRATRDGRTEIQVADPAAARAAVAKILEKVETTLRSPARGAAAGSAAAWVARFANRADPGLVAEISGRAGRAVIPSRLACLMPDLVPVRDAAGEVIDARLAPATDFTLQMLRYAGKLPFEPAR
jgi:dipeptidyl-peptidase-3